jgi:chromosomal replication initiator protein
MLDLKKLWEDSLVDIELDLSKANFGTWFRNTRLVKHDGGIVYLGVPNTFVKEWLCTKYHRSILKSLRTFYPELRSLEYLIIRSADQEKNHPTQTPNQQTFPNQLEMVEIYINRDDNLNPKYTFDNFVVGPFNELAHAASQAIIKRPGVVYNPLFIYGGTGVGKTHLIQSIGNTLKHQNSNKKIYYVTSEQFVIDYVNAMQGGRGNQFKDKYRKYDVLILDDIQFLSKKDKSQEELFHLFNNFYENNKQIIFSSDKSPKYIPDLEDRLRSRFEGGMIVDIARPDFESRLAILRAKLKNNSFTPTLEVMDYIASTVQESIRELEGALNSIICQSQLKNRNLSLVEVKQLIKNSIRPKKNVSIKNIVEVVANFYNIAERSLYDKTRKKEVVKPRQIIMFILREDFNSSYPYIGQKMGGRDHTTVIHAYEKIKLELKNNPNLTQELEQIRGMLYHE